MIKLIDILNEAPLFGMGKESPVLKLVWSSKSGVFKDETKRKEFLRVIERNLKMGKSTIGYDYDINTILDNIQYYPATDKFVGNLPVSIFFKGIHSINNAVNIDRCRFKDELMKISKDIEVKRK